MNSRTWTYPGSSFFSQLMTSESIHQCHCDFQVSIRLAYCWSNRQEPMLYDMTGSFLLQNRVKVIACFEKHILKLFHLEESRFQAKMDHQLDSNQRSLSSSPIVNPLMLMLQCCKNGQEGTRKERKRICYCSVPKEIQSKTRVCFKDNKIMRCFAPCIN